MCADLGGKVKLTGFTFGNGVTESIGYTAQRYQLNSVSYTNSGTTLFSLTYGYTQNGGNNGQITSITDNVDSGRTVNYTFDALHRLSTAVTNGSTNYAKWGLSWTYDRYGNRTAQTVTAGSAYSGSPTVDPNTNRITALGSASFSYDSSGNLTQDDLYQYVYDAESRLVQLQQLNGTAIATYSLDGEGLRVIKVVGTARTYSLYDGTDLIAEFSDYSTTTYTSGTTPAQAPADSISLMLYQFSDHLTTRMSADNFASNASYEGHYPFGETWYETGMAYPSVTKKFASYNRDTEAGNGFLNYAVFRQHSSRLGRFHMADPVRGRTNNPQSLNRFSYGLSDPINNEDPTGLINVKIEIPPDWPCSPFDVVCGCDPFELAICTEGGDYPPSAGDGEPGPSPCNPTISSYRVAAFCDGSTKNRSSITIGSRYGGSQVADSEVVSVKNDNEVFIEFVGDYQKNELIPNSYYQLFRAHKPTGKKSFSTTGNIIWNVRFTCYGQGTGEKTVKQGVSCAE